jgi:hypothetical protein
VYTFDTTGNGYDILNGSDFVIHVDDIETAKALCKLLNKSHEKEDCPSRDCPILYGANFVVCIQCGRNPRRKEANNYE